MSINLAAFHTESILIENYYEHNPHFAADQSIIVGIENYLLLPPPNSVFPCPSACTSASLGSSPGGVTYTFIPEVSGEFTILPELGPSFPLTSVKAMVTLGVILRDLLHLQYNILFLHCATVV